MAQRSSSHRTLEAALVAILFLAIGLGFLVYGARPWSTELASRHGAGIDAMMNFLLTTTGAMFVIGHVVLATLIFQGALRGRVALRMASSRTERRLALGLGLLMAFAAEGGVLAIGIPVFKEYFGDIPEDAVVIEVTAQQFAWNVRYRGPDGTFARTDPGLISIDNPIGIDASDPAAADDRLFINQLTVPVGRPVHLVLKSRDVIHSFFLPAHRVKQDAVPGMTIDIWFFPTREGSFEIPCTELCGLGHYRMEGLLRVVSESEYQQFVAPAVADGQGGAR